MPKLPGLLMAVGGKPEGEPGDPAPPIDPDFVALVEEADDAETPEERAVALKEFVQLCMDDYQGGAEGE